MNWQVVIPWAKGLLAAFISAAANAITATVVAPTAFNFGGQWKQTLTLAAVSGAVSVATYLAKSPLPETKEENK